jgi:hypothetical protein
VPQPARKPRIPAYRLHKANGQAIVSIRGRMFYLGRGAEEWINRRQPPEYVSSSSFVAIIPKLV